MERDTFPENEELVKLDRNARVFFFPAFCIVLRGNNSR